MLTDLNGIPIKVGDKVIVEIATYYFMKRKYVPAIVVEELKNKKVKVLAVCGTTHIVSTLHIWADVGNPTVCEGTPVIGSYVISGFNGGVNSVAKIIAVNNVDRTAKLETVFGKLLRSNTKWVSQNTLRYVDSYVEYLIKNHPELLV